MELSTVFFHLLALHTQPTSISEAIVRGKAVIEAGDRPEIDHRRTFKTCEVYLHPETWNTRSDTYCQEVSKHSNEMDAMTNAVKAGHRGDSPDEWWTVVAFSS